MHVQKQHAVDQQKVPTLVFFLKPQTKDNLEVCVSTKLGTNLRRHHANDIKWDETMNEACPLFGNMFVNLQNASL